MKVTVKKSVKAVAAKTVTKKAESQVKSKFPIIGSLLYKALRGCALFLANIRKDDIKAQPFVAMPKTAIPVIAWAESQFGVCVSMVKAAGNVVQVPERELGFDMSAVGGVALKPKDAIAKAKKQGKAHEIHRKTAKKGVNETGYMIGDLANQYVGWYNAKTGVFDTLETKALPDGRNAARLFELVK